MNTETTTTEAADELRLVDIVGKLPKVKPATAAQKERIRGASKLAFLVPYGQLLVADDNIRQADRDPAKLKALAENIKAMGLVQAIAATPHGANGDAGWLIAAGHRRYLALTMLGFKAADLVPIHPLDPAGTGATRAQRMVAENFHREGLTPIEEAELIERLQSVYGMSQRAIADHLGWNKSTVNKRLNLLDLPEEVQALVDAGDMAVEHGEGIGKLVRDGAPDTMVTDLVQRNASGWLDHRTIEAATTKLKGIKAADTLTARLEARGVKVVFKAGRAPTKKGHEAYQDHAIELDTAAAVRELDLGGLRTIKTKDGKPVLMVDRRYDGAAVAWVLKQRKKTAIGHGTGDDGGTGDWPAARAAREAIERVRLASVADLDPPGDIDGQRLATAALLANVSNEGIRQVAQWCGLETAAEGEAWDAAGIVAGWVADAPTPKLRAIQWAAVRWEATRLVRDGGTIFRQGATPYHVAALQAAGMTPGLDDEAFAKARKLARSRLDAAMAKGTDTTTDTDGEEE